MGSDAAVAHRPEAELGKDSCCLHGSGSVHCCLHGSGSGTLLSTWQWQWDTVGSGNETLLLVWPRHCDTVVCLAVAL